MRNTLSAVLAIVVFIGVIIVMIIPLSGILHDLRVDGFSEGLGCTASGTSCTITLTSDHEHFDTTHITVTETAPGAADRTSTSTLDARGRNDIVVEGLTDTVIYAFTVGYEIQGSNISNELEDFLRLTGPTLIFFMVIGVFVLGAVGIRSFLGEKAT